LEEFTGRFGFEVETELDLSSADRWSVGEDYPIFGRFGEDSKVKQLRGKEIPLVKVVWGGATGESLT